MSETIKPRPSNLKPRARGFTLIEILVVIGIIVILLSILIPVVSKVRKSAQVAGVQAQINGLTGAIQRYQQDHGAYPGPIGNGDIYLTGFTDVATLTTPPQGFVYTMGTTNTYKITGSENLVLGLLGGLVLQGAAPGQVAYNPAMVGGGPSNLNFGQQKRFAPYIEATNLSWRDTPAGKTGKYEDEVAAAMDSIIPEFVDTFPDPMPILYLRAKKGSPQPAGPTFTATNNRVITNTDVESPPTVIRGHYNLRDILAYTGPGTTAGGGTGEAFIGAGKDIRPDDYVDPPVTPQAGKLPHGLADVQLNKSLLKAPPSPKQYEYPYDAYPYFTNPSSSTTEPQPRSKDGYILISAGLDRVYGTPDDITSFGAVNAE